MIESVVLTLAGALQAWGGPAVSPSLRPTEPEPTLSGVAGLIANVMGRGRDHPVDDLAAARMHIRTDRPGVPLRDFHTVGSGATRCARCGTPRTGKTCGGCGARDWHTDGVPEAKSLDPDNRAKSKVVNSTNPITGNRWYLSDAAFTVHWEPGPDGPDAARIAEALQRPHRPPYLGRRSCPPDAPLLVGITTHPPEAVFAALPLLRSHPEHLTGIGAPASHFDDVGAVQTDETFLVRVTYHTADPDPGASARHDIPASFDPATRWHLHHYRWTRTEQLAVPAAGIGRSAYQTRRTALAQLSESHTHPHPDPARH